MGMLQVRIDDELKNQAVVVFEQLGIDLSTAIRMFLKRSVLVGGIPFEAKIDETTLKSIVAVESMRNISEKNGNSEMTLDEINEEIKKAREERRNINKRLNALKDLVGAAKTESDISINEKKEGRLKKQ